VVVAAGALERCNAGHSSMLLEEYLPVRRSRTGPLSGSGYEVSATFVAVVSPLTITFGEVTSFCQGA
jgi:hypothetical protein